MRTWKIVITTLAVNLLAVGIATASIIYSGAYNVAATSKHWSITRWALQTTVHRSVAEQASDIDVPELGTQRQLLAGAANFDAMCSGCHAPPGTNASPAAQGMYPSPPDLSHSGKDMPARKIFWIIKHGIKASGMPAWGVTHNDEKMWAMTAFIKRLPGISRTGYRHMLQTAKARGIGHEHSGEEHPGAGHNGKENRGHHAHDHSEKPNHGSVSTSLTLADKTNLSETLQ